MLISQCESSELSPEKRGLNVLREQVLKKLKMWTLNQKQYYRNEGDAYVHKIKQKNPSKAKRSTHNATTGKVSKANTK